MALYAYVDNSNIWIEGCRLSAVHRGLATSLEDAYRRDVIDMSWTYDFGQLYDAVCPPGADIGRAVLFGSEPPSNEALWSSARGSGFEVFVAMRSAANKEKEVDTSLATLMMEDSYERMVPGDRAVLVSGDRDYLPTVKSLARRGFPTVVVGWSHATSKALIAAASAFSPLDDLFAYLTE